MRWVNRNDSYYTHFLMGCQELFAKKGNFFCSAQTIDARGGGGAAHCLQNIACIFLAAMV